MKKELDNNNKIITENRKAKFNYFLSEFTECGISLTGTEIKSLRTKGASLNDSYVVFKDGEGYILNMHIPVYDQGNIFNHEPLRTRKLLLHKKEIKFFFDKIRIEGYTVVPYKVYLKHGRAKIEIALAKGKKNFEKREAIKIRDMEKEMDRR